MCIRYLLAALLATAAAAQEPLARTRFEAQKGLMFADFVVRGRTVSLAIDSGSKHCTLDLEKARELGINIDQAALSSGPHTQSGPLEVRVAENVTYELGAVRITAPITVVYSLNFLAKRIGRPVDGIVGADLFRSFVLEFDYAGQEVRACRPETYVPPANARALRVEEAGGQFTVRGKILPAPVTRTGECTSCGGDRKARMGRLGGRLVGDARIQDAEVRLSDAYVSGDVPSSLCGNLGSGFFQRFKEVFDIPNARLWLR